jgi:hypothetical protein
MRSWADSLTEVTVDITAAYTPIEMKPYGDYNTPYTDNTLDGGSSGTAVVPAGSPYRLVLDYRPKRNSLSITLNGVTTSLREAGAIAAAGAVVVDYVSGELLFHSADTGKAVVATYKHFGSVPDPYFVMKMEKMIEALRLGLGAGGGLDVRQYFIPGVPVEAGRVYNQGYIAHTTASRLLKRISVFANDISSLSATESDVTQISVVIGSSSWGASLVVTGTDDEKRFVTVEPESSEQRIEFTEDTPIQIIVADVAGGHGNLTVELTIQ